MDFSAIRTLVIELLQREGRVAYRALKLQFQLDDDTVAALQDDLIYAKRLAVDEGGRVLVWTGGTDTPPSPSPSTSPALQPVTPEAPIYHWFTEGFDTADLQEARTLLEALGA